MIISQANRVVYNGYKVASTSFVYDSDGGTGASDGWVLSKYDDVVLQVALGTLTSGKVLYQVEGRFDGLNRPALVYTASMTATTTIDGLVELSQKVKEIRVGVKADTIASPLSTNNCFYCGLVLSERS